MCQRHPRRRFCSVNSASRCTPRFDAAADARLPFRIHYLFHDHTAEKSMSKGLDSKKSDKKKPEKTMKEKKLAKQEKKKNAK
jgi:hypothetical protein